MKSRKTLSLRNSTLLWVTVSALSWFGIAWSVSTLVSPMDFNDDVIAMEEAPPATEDELVEILKVQPASGPWSGDEAGGACLCPASVSIEFGDPPVY